LKTIRDTQGVQSRERENREKKGLNFVLDCRGFPGYGGRFIVKETKEGRKRGMRGKGNLVEFVFSVLWGDGGK